MKYKPEQYLHLAAALVTGAAPFALNSTAVALMLAAISLAHAAKAGQRDTNDSEPL